MKQLASRCNVYPHTCRWCMYAAVTVALTNGNFIFCNVGRHGQVRKVCAASVARVLNEVEVTIFEPTPHAVLKERSFISWQRFWPRWGGGGVQYLCSSCMIGWCRPFRKKLRSVAVMPAVLSPVRGNWVAWMPNLWVGTICSGGGGGGSFTT